jgi:hypothetical protein
VFFFAFPHSQVSDTAVATSILSSTNLIFSKKLDLQKCDLLICPMIPQCLSRFLAFSRASDSAQSGQSHPTRAFSLCVVKHGQECPSGGCRLSALRSQITPTNLFNRIQKENALLV